MSSAPLLRHDLLSLNHTQSQSASLTKLLDSVGLYRIRSNVAELAQSIANVLDSAELASSETGACRPLPSHIPLTFQPVKPVVGDLLNFDIGGTKVGISVRTVHESGEITWRFLTEVSNASLKPESVSTERNPIRQLMLKIADVTEAALREQALLVSGCIRGMTLCWSNPFEPEIKDRSLTGLIGPQHNSQKGEWFLNGITEMTDLGGTLAQALGARGFHIEKYLVSNDVPFTQMATNSARGGVVASTGANGTVPMLDPARPGRLCVGNGELGRIFVPTQFLSDVERISSAAPLSLEGVSTGAFLPTRFREHVMFCAQHGQTELVALAQRLESNPELMVSNPQLTAALADTQEPRSIPLFHGMEENISRLAHRAAQELIRTLALRSAAVTGVMGYLTLREQLALDGELIVSLDSSMCRWYGAQGLPYFSEASEVLNSLVGSERAPRFSLCHPLPVEGGSISVPQLGGAHAFDVMNS